MRSPLGQPIRRREDAALVTGRGRFVEDLNIPGTLYLSFARGPHAKARITRIDTAAARRSAGVVEVITAADLAGVPDMPLNQRVRGMHVPPNPVLARDTVNAVGIGVAAVVAESRAEAEDGAALVDVDYASLEGVGSAADALAAGAPLAWDQLAGNLSFCSSRAGGDVERAFVEADHVVSLTIDNHRLAPVAIEPRAVLAVPDPLGDGLTIWGA